jgi:hypothetical protein
MLRRFGLFIVITACLLVALPGCSGKREWEITVENKGDVPASVFVKMRADGSSNAKIDDLTKGKIVTLIAENGETIVHTVKVVRGKDEQTLKPNAKLPAGKRYAIVVGADGKVETSISDQ